MILFRNAPLRRRGLAIALGFGAALMVAGVAQADPKILAKIDGVPITEDDVKDALQDIGPGLPQKLDVDEAGAPAICAGLSSST